jgi:hypothetical protein
MKGVIIINYGTGIAPHSSIPPEANRDTAYLSKGKGNHRNSTGA